MKLKLMSLRNTLILDLLDKAVDPLINLADAFRVQVDKILDLRPLYGDKDTLGYLEELNKAYEIIKGSQLPPAREVMRMLTIDYSEAGDGSGTAYSEILAVHEELFTKCIDALDLGSIGYDELYNGNLKFIHDEL